MRKDILWHRFGRLTVVAQAGSNHYGCAMWLTRCDCGVEEERLGTALRAWAKQSRQTPIQCSECARASRARRL